MPSLRRQRIYPTLRALTLSTLSLLLLAFLFVQAQQHLLRYRAEKLNADIAYLRDHSGTWADLQRIQHRWGAFAHYDGPCNSRHCDYIVYLTDPFYSLIHRNQRHPFYPDLLIPIYQKLGGRLAVIDADVHLTNNHIWGALIEVDLGDSFPIMAAVEWSPRLFTGFGSGLLSGFSERRPNVTDIRRGYLIYQPGACTGCIMRRVHLTPATPRADRDRLSIIDFSCLTRFHPCDSMAEVLPNAEAQNIADYKHPDNADASCMLSIARRASEADNIVTINLLASRSTKAPDNSVEYTAVTQFTERLKNGFAYALGQTVYVDEGGTYPGMPITQFSPVLPLPPGEYLLFFNPRDIDSYKPKGIDPWSCSIMPDTPATRAEVAKGIAADPSTGEEFNPTHRNLRWVETDP